MLQMLIEQQRHQGVILLLVMLWSTPRRHRDVPHCGAIWGTANVAFLHLAGMRGLALNLQLTPASGAGCGGRAGWCGCHVSPGILAAQAVLRMINLTLPQ